MIYDPDVQTLAALPAAQARRYPTRVALLCGDASLTFAELDERSAALACWFRDQGLTPGTRVALLSKESIDSIVLLFGLARAGAVVVPVNWRLTESEVAFIVANSRCQVLCVSAEHRGLARATADCRLLVIEELWTRNRASSRDLPAVSANDSVVHVYTSGTTGFPKAVDLPNASFFAIARGFAAEGRRWLDWSEHEVGLCALPTFHIGGLWWLVRILASGGSAVLLPQFVGWQAIEAIERHRVTLMAVVPAMLHVMLSEPDAATSRFASLRVVGYGGSPMPPRLLEWAMSKLPCEFHQVYGLSETGNMAVSLSSEDHRVPGLRSAVGRALPGVQIKIVDETGRALAPFEVGEICLHTPAAMRGYWQETAATAAVLRDGWVHTGDAGHLDDAGYLYVSDRIKDMICSAGEKVWPAEVEAVLATHPAVREVAVVGEPHPQWGETVKAVVVPQTAAGVTLSELRSFARGRVAEFKLPSRLQLAESLPRTAAGKVQKRLLREMRASEA